MQFGLSSPQSGRFGLLSTRRVCQLRWANKKAHSMCALDNKIVRHHLVALITRRFGNGFAIHLVTQE
ncbi:hypothetical protein COO31_014690 [Vibrio vulnificus]|nr:hypothetical protein COO31_014690 [Vibrio vulnificus]